MRGHGLTGPHLVHVAQQHAGGHALQQGGGCRDIAEGIGINGCRRSTSGSPGYIMTIASGIGATP